MNIRIGQSLTRIGLILALALAASVSLSSVVLNQPAAQAQPGSAPAASYDWPQFNFDSSHSGSNPLETTLGLGNAASLHRLFQAQLPDIADGAPVHLAGVSTPGGVRDLVFVTTHAGHIIALDAHTGAQVWIKQNPPGTCRINNGSTPCYTTSSPAIDPNRQYVYSYGLDGRVHKYRVGDGVEIIGSGWPELATLKSFDEKGSSALAVATTAAGQSFLYVANGGYPGDRGDYQGHVTAINLADGTQQVFNANCSNQPVHFVTAPGTPNCGAVQTAVWARPGVVFSPATGKLYFATGNGDYAPASHNWGDSVLAINPNGTGANGNPLDSYTPSNYQQLEDTDADLGSTAPAILPALPNSSVPHLAVQAGKDAKLRLLNLDNLSSQGGIGHTGGEVGSVISVPQGGGVLTTPAVWTNPSDNSVWVFVTSSQGISGLKLVVSSGGVPGLQPVWQKPMGGTSPIVANRVLYYAGGSSIRALNPTTGDLLWSDTQIGSIHWESPIVANGVLYISDGSAKLTAYTPFVPSALPHAMYLPAVLK